MHDSSYCITSVVEDMSNSLTGRSGDAGTQCNGRTGVAALRLEVGDMKEAHKLDSD